MSGAIRVEHSREDIAKGDDKIGLDWIRAERRQVDKNAADWSEVE